MSFGRIIKEIQQEKELLEDQLDNKDPEYEFLERFVQNNFFSKVEDILQIDIIDFIIAFFSVNKNQLSFLEIEKCVRENSNYFTDLDANEMQHYKIAMKKLMNIANNYNDSASLLGKIIFEIMIKIIPNMTEVDILALVRLFSDNKDAFLLTSDFALVFSEMKDVYGFKVVRSDRKKVSEKKSRQITSEYIKSRYDMNRIRNMFIDIQKYYDEVKANRVSTQKKIKKQIINYSSALEILGNYVSGEFTQVDTVVSLLKKPEIRMDLLREIDEINQCEYKKLLDEYSKFSQTPELQIQKILMEFQLSYASLNEKQKQILRFYRIEDLREIFILLRNMRFADSQIIRILETSNKDIIVAVIELIRNGILMLEYVQNRLKIFTSHGYQQFSDKLSIVASYEINPMLFVNDQSVWDIDASLLSKNLSLLENYYLIFVLKNMNEFSCLKDDNLMEKIDTLLELGYEDYLEIYPDILNRKIDRIKRVRLLKEIGESPKSIGELISVLDSWRFIVDDDSIDDYLFNVVPFRMDVHPVSMSFDSEYVLTEGQYFKDISSTTRTYKIGNMFFSKNRVERNRKMFEFEDISEQDKRFYSLVYGAFLNEEEWDSVHQQICQSSLDFDDKKLSKEI